MRLFSNIFSIFIIITLVNGLVNGFEIKNIFQKYHIEDMEAIYKKTMNKYEEFQSKVIEYSQIGIDKYGDIYDKALEYSQIGIDKYGDVHSKTQEQFVLYKKYFICTAINKLNKLNQSLSS